MDGGSQEISGEMHGRSNEKYRKSNGEQNGRSNEEQKEKN